MGTMTWRRTRVQGRPAAYGESRPGDGSERPTVLFLHGWALSDHSYRGSLDRLARAGFTVLAPALPGFGGTAGLPPEQVSLGGYADWLVDFLDEAGHSGEATLVGHSFGGAVAIRYAFEQPERVSQLVLVNSIGGATWSADGRLMSDRSLGDWGVHLGAELASARGLTRVLPVIASDAVRHALLRPGTLWRVGRLAREAELGMELEELKRRRLPVAVLWGREDAVIPWACAESLIEALGDPQVVTVPGNHGWLISDPGRFVEVLTNVLSLVDGSDGEVA
ncbi:alpha/beta fold hydrolase [Nocardioides euryhalodurans]|uniref:Alpha/beta fold hydrolase n=1 Tax=Nocardioides euryhalodurans TaxID=2518370 RepID=A0A4P7GIK6_9ACTN|nr:alpha/beta fold hydrolase [Nocardioides euryhalodurans]QBR91800.1 alpha/beta fold hydrolase [Nocardioides euryhalodurans]